MNVSEMASQKHCKRLPEPAQVRYTGDWSSDSKLSSIENAYWNDKFFAYFNAPHDMGKIPKRTSLICRGYYVRFKLCDYFLKQTLNPFNGTQMQIVSLGCGMDTTYFRLISEQAYCDMVHRYFELDFPSVVQRKLDIIASNEMLEKLAGGKLVLIEHDLRDLNTLREKLANSGFDYSKPTLFYSECVVNYLKPNESEAILSWITANVPNCVWLAYEQCNPNDAFGRLMVQHFRRNGCPILSIEENGDVESQKAQLARTGFQHSAVFNVWDSFVQLAKPEEFVNVTETQQFDEYEAFVGTCLHYSVRIGNNCDKVLPQFTNLIPASASVSVPRLPLLKLTSKEVLTSYMTLSTFSTHCSVLVNDKIWVLGGTNENGTRLPGVTELCCLIDPGTKQFQLIENPVTVPKTSIELERVHSAATFVKQLNRVYTFGGRKSPRAPYPAELICINLNDEKNAIVSVAKVNSTYSTRGPCPRWRHALTSFVRNDGGICLVLFGGKTEKEILGGRWIYDCFAGTWEYRDNYGNSPSPSARHSHSICVDEERESIFVVGGMSSDTNICEDSVWEYKYNEDRWISHPELSKHARKVGAIALIRKDELVVLGGYGKDSFCGLEHFMARINLKTHEVRHYELDLGPSIFLPFGFTAHVIHSDEQGDIDEFVAVLGGGGNCFSFGTHYNCKCLLLKLSSLE